MSDLPMNAYYYAFYETSERSINEILSAVAMAGKRSHHAEDWSEDRCGDGSPVESIQEAARCAAGEMSKLRECARAAERSAILLADMIMGAGIDPALVDACVPELKAYRAKAASLGGELE